MRKLTVAEMRERELRNASEKYGIEYKELKTMMNRYYRLCGAYERLLYLENDEKTCNNRYTKEVSNQAENRFFKLNSDFKNLNRTGILYPFAWVSLPCVGLWLYGAFMDFLRCFYAVSCYAFQYWQDCDTLNGYGLRTAATSRGRAIPKRKCEQTVNICTFAARCRKNLISIPQI